MSKTIGILTAGGDSPGLNAAIRAIGKTAKNKYGMRVVGFNDGFRGIVQNRYVPLDTAALSGILTMGGTILGTGRDKPHKMDIGGEIMDMTPAIIEHYEKLNLDTLVALGGGGTQKNALRLSQAGLHVITLPKTIDNDVYGTDVSFGFDTALAIATESVDRLHSTAHSHHRIIVVETMGHNSGWLALGSGIAGGADAALIPENPYRIEKLAEAVLTRKRKGKTFSIITVAEGAIAVGDHSKLAELKEELLVASKEDRVVILGKIRRIRNRQGTATVRLAGKLEDLTGLNARVTILGHVQRGGTPTPTDRVLASRLGVTAADLAEQGTHGVMVSVQGTEMKPVKLINVAGNRKTIPENHSWMHTATQLGMCLG